MIEGLRGEEGYIPIRLDRFNFELVVSEILGLCREFPRTF